MSTNQVFHCWVIIPTLLYLLRWTYADPFCPCIPIFPKKGEEPFKTCGWMLNLMVSSAECENDEIYFGCKHENATEANAKVAHSCANECFMVAGKGITCGYCEKWSSGNALCEKVAVQGYDQKKIPAKYNPRPRPNTQLKGNVGRSLSKGKGKSKDGDGDEDPKILNIQGRGFTAGADASDIYDEPCNCDTEQFAKLFSLELVFVQDASVFYTTVQTKGRDTWVQGMRHIMSSLTTEIDLMFGGKARYGLTSFSDWEARTGCKKDYCYKCICTLRKGDQFKDCYKNVPAAVGVDQQQSSLTAIIYTAMEKKMGWTSATFKDKRRVVKVIVLITNGDWISQDNINGTNDKTVKFPWPKMDGTDTCKNGPPDSFLVEKPLMMSEIMLIGIVGDKSLIYTWDKNFYYLWQRESSFITVVSPKVWTDIGKMVIAVKNSLKRIICYKYFPEAYNVPGL